VSAGQVLRRYGPVATLVTIVALVAAELAQPPGPRPADAVLPQPVDPWLWTSSTQLLPVIVCR